MIYKSHISKKMDDEGEQHTRLFLKYFWLQVAQLLVIGDMPELNAYILRNRGLEVIIHTKIKYMT
jgi:hypothetical protein